MPASSGWEYTPWRRKHASSYPAHMKIHPRKKPLTLGEFIMGVYDGCADNKAGAILWIAFHSRLVVSRRRSKQGSI